MEIREVLASDDFNAIAPIYMESWRIAYKGMVPQAFLDALSGDGWSTMLREENSHLL